MHRLFGTDGVRGIANEALSCERATQIGRALGTVLSSRHKYRPKVLIGMDTRLSSPMLASAIAAGLCSAGILSVGILALGLLLAVGSIAVGLIAVGAIAVGILAIGALSAGLISVGAFSIGQYLAVGDHAYGMIAVGDSVAAGKIFSGQGLTAAELESRLSELFALAERHLPPVLRGIAKGILRGIV